MRQGDIERRAVEMANNVDGVAAYNPLMARLLATGKPGSEECAKAASEAMRIADRIYVHDAFGKLIAIVRYKR